MNFERLDEQSQQLVRFVNARHQLEEGKPFDLDNIDTCHHNGTDISVTFNTGSEYLYTKDGEFFKTEEFH
ncbi:hypothetical protein SAMN04488134_11450 [Amphibacillus marinus]|uniref:Uncharacterized protein n=1 Tax=Amphibacillus marinus TaxID=872970 RepID=A0A1H8T277_9BACI|nr:hypothetical protein [Amphibacillus marinus]SEO85032.1 hypothetical protein SAMN04488134_11450 [Amphibacillus marinus]